MRFHRLAAFAFAVIGFLTTAATADFVKIGTIKGSAVEDLHVGWIATGNWGTETKQGFWIFSSPINTFWFEKQTDGASSALIKAMQSKTFYDHVLFDVVIKGTVIRTTFYAVRVVSVERQGGIEKVTLQFKTQRDQRVRFEVPRH